MIPRVPVILAWIVDSGTADKFRNALDYSQNRGRVPVLGSEKNEISDKKSASLMQDFGYRGKCFDKRTLRQ